MLKIEDPKFKLIIGELEKLTPPERVAFFAWRDEDDQEARANKLLLWWFYYYGNNFVCLLVDFHYDWIFAMAGEKNQFKKGFRGSLKTEIAKVYVTNSICYARWKYIIWQSFESDSSSEDVQNIAKMLENPLLKKDYGQLFPFKVKREEMAKKSMSNFNTTNGVKIKALSFGQKARGAVSYDYETGSNRPDLLIVNDIDVTDSVQNNKIITKNYNKLTNETIGAMSKEKSRIIFDGNVIKEDGIVPRFEKGKKGDSNWDVFVQTLYDEQGDVVWDFFTKEKIAGFLTLEGEMAFNQNYKLIPYSEGDTIIKREHIHWITLEEIPKLTSTTIGIDPASSTKTFTDSFAIVVIGHIGMRKIIIETKELKGAEKGTENMLEALRILYERYHARCVNIEFVSLQREFCEYLYNLLKNHRFNVNKVVPTKDKVARLSEHEAEFSRGDIQFVENSENKSLVDQLLSFPNSEHDDMVDAMVYGFINKQPARHGILSRGGG